MVVVGTEPGERRHDQAVGKLVLANLQRLKELRVLRCAPHIDGIDVCLGVCMWALLSVVIAC